MIVDDKEAFEGWYDALVLRAGNEGITTPDIKAAMRRTWLADALESDESKGIKVSTLEAIGKILVSSEVDRIRANRSAGRSKHFDHLRRAIHEGWLANLEPEFLDRAYPSAGGVNKALGDWTINDFIAITEHSRKALESATATHSRNSESLEILSPKMSDGETIRELYQRS